MGIGCPGDGTGGAPTVGAVVGWGPLENCIRMVENFAALPEGLILPK